MNRLTKIRDNETVTVYDSNGYIVESITRNLYSYYISNNNPVYCRYMGEWFYIHGSFSPFTIQLNGLHQGSHIKKVTE